MDAIFLSGIKIKVVRLAGQFECRVLENDNLIFHKKFRLQTSSVELFIHRLNMKLKLAVSVKLLFLWDLMTI